MINFDKIEDLILENRFVKDTWIEDVYFSIWGFKRRISDNYYRPFKNFFHNIVKYRRFLAKDYWFDSYFIFEMLRDKLEKDAINYRKYGNTTVANECADQMDECVEILNRIIADEYEEIELKPHNEKWGKIDFTTRTDEEFRIKRSGVKTEEDEIQESKEFLFHMNVARIKRENDVCELFDKMKENILEWWD